MAITKRNPKYETDDGREFDSPEAAQRHERFLEVKKEYKAAKIEFNRLLAESQKTADGYPFRFNSGAYYYIFLNYFGMPRLSRVDFFIWQIEFDEEDALTIYQKNDAGDWTKYPISELFYLEKNAKKALLAASEERIKDYAEDIQRLREELNR